VPLQCTSSVTRSARICSARHLSRVHADNANFAQHTSSVCVRAVTELTTLIVCTNGMHLHPPHTAHLNVRLRLLQVDSELPVPLAGQINTMFALCTALLAPSVRDGEILARTSLECVVVFALVWSVGGLVIAEHRQLVHMHLKQRCTPTLIPQDQPDHTV
jgi:hypothetical protein